MPDPGYREQATTPGREALAALRARGDATRLARAARVRRARKIAITAAVALPILGALLLVLWLTVLPHGWIGLTAMCCFVLTAVPGLMAMGLRNPSDPNMHRTVKRRPVGLHPSVSMTEGASS